MHLWTDLIHDYVGEMIARYGLAEVESWVWVMYNEPGGINAYSKEWQTGGFTCERASARMHDLCTLRTAV
jgi:hypothetical protein